MAPPRQPDSLPSHFQFSCRDSECREDEERSERVSFNSLAEIPLGRAGLPSRPRAFNSLAEIQTLLVPLRPSALETFNSLAEIRGSTCPRGEGACLLSILLQRFKRILDGVFEGRGVNFQFSCRDSQAFRHEWGKEA